MPSARRARSFPLQGATLTGARTQRQMHRFRRILVRWEQKAAHDTAMLHLPCAFIAFRQAGVG